MISSSSHPNRWLPPKTLGSSLDPVGEYETCITDYDDGVPVAVLQGCLTPGDCASLISAMGTQTLQPVDVFGHAGADQASVGSKRVTAWSPDLADVLWEKIRDGVLHLTRGVSDLPDGRITCGNTFPTDWYGDGTRKEHRRWRAVGVSPVLRFMRYERGGEHAAHYDAGYDYETENPKDRRRTLASVVWYLTTNEDGGQTRLVDDGQSAVPTPLRDHRDWAGIADDYDVQHVFYPIEGNAVIFWHRMCHDVSPYFGGDPRIIIRGDVIFEAEDD